MNRGDFFSRDEIEKYILYLLGAYGVDFRTFGEMYKFTSYVYRKYHKTVAQ